MKRFFLSATLVLFASVSGAPPANAQALADTALHPGARIRVQSRALGASPRVGIFVSFANDSLSFTPERSAALTRLSVTQVDALEVSVKRTTNVIRDADKGKHYGGFIGALVGGIAGAASAPAGDNTVRGLLTFVGLVGGYFAGQLYGTVAGGAAGVVDRDDEWKPVSLPAPTLPKASPRQ